MSHTCSERSPSYDNFKGYKLTDVPEPDMELVHVGPRTPCGELLRRYWQPIAQSVSLRNAALCASAHSTKISCFSGI